MATRFAPCDACAEEGKPFCPYATIRIAFRPEDTTSNIFYFCPDHADAFEENWLRFGGDRNTYNRRALKA